MLTRLVQIGCMMIRQITSINWRYIGDAVPAFVTLMFIPFSYSIAYGLIAGLLTYVLINGPIFLIRKLSRDRYLPENYDKREEWRPLVVEESTLFKPLRSFAEFFNVESKDSASTQTEMVAEHFDKAEDQRV